LRNGAMTGFDAAAKPAPAYQRGPIARVDGAMPIRFSLLPR
jgi:hypothetical protein